MQKNVQQKWTEKKNQTELKVEKVIKRKCDKIFVKQKGHYNSFNSWIDKKDILILIFFGVIFQNHIPVVKARYIKFPKEVDLATIILKIFQDNSSFHTK